MATILQRIAEKLAIYKKDVGLVQVDNQIEMIDSLKAIEKNTAEKPEKPEKIDFTEVIAKLDTLTEEVKKKEQSQYDLQIDPVAREKLKGDKGDKGDAGKSIKPTRAELEAIIRAVVPDYVPSAGDLELLLEGMDIVSKSEDFSKVQEELDKLSEDVRELQTFDPEKLSQETIKKALGFIPSRSGGGVLSITSSDGSVVINASMAKGKGVVDLSVVGSGSGDVVGPASAIDDEIVVFDGVTGKLIRSEGQTFSALSLILANLVTGKQNNITLTTTGSSGPATLIADVLNIPQYTGGGGGISSIVEGDNITVDNTDPANPIVSAYFGNVDDGVVGDIPILGMVIDDGVVV